MRRPDARTAVADIGMPLRRTPALGRHALALSISLSLSMSLSMAILACGDDGPVGLADAGSQAQATDGVGSTPPLADAAPAARPPAHARRVFFGDLHIHSSWSLDAWGSGVRAGPEAAYRYARGEAIPHVSGEEIQLAGPPLDFMALTDHAEYLGVVAATEEPVHPLHSLRLFKEWMSSDRLASRAAWGRIDASFRLRSALPELATDEVVGPAWRELVELADRYDDPGRFSAFVGFEYSSNPESQNLHRNVIFRGSDVPDRPFSAMDSANPEALWDWMDRVRREGDDLLAIPHNANGSNGRMFALERFDGGPIDRDWLDQRRRNEPLVELIQIKGQSETRPLLSPEDEWADFEVAPWRTLNPALPSRAEGSYARWALLQGLRLRERFGRDPFAVGFVGSTDGHNAASPFEERNYTGKIGTGDATPARRLAGTTPPELAPNPYAHVGVFWSAAGLAGIWADANTRADLFDAMRRRETFATSGPRIRVRFFGGWDFADDDAGADLARAGYAKGVPMGGELDAGDAGGGTAAGLGFLVAAQKDPLEADLERLQIVKGWLESGEPRERVYDVACGDGARPDPGTHRCPRAAAPPDPATCAPDSEAGASELRVAWHDPDFDPGQRAFYYVRVLQVPTCRWSTWDALQLGVPPPAVVPWAIQERAVTSAIWIDPA